MITITGDGSVTAEEARKIGEGVEAGFTITCGQCGSTTPAGSWCSTPINGELPAREFQCPQCGYHFRRQAHDGDPYRYVAGVFCHKPIELVQLPTTL